jgi:hypothetical protein
MPRRAHALDVLGVGLFADEDDLLAGLGPLDGVVGGEDDLAAGAAGTGRQALGHRLGLLLGLGIDDRVQQLVELRGLTRITAVFSSISFSLSMSMAMFGAAVPVRLPTRHCSMYSLPS